jgi:ketosteroid isomerase-like protein
MSSERIMQSRRGFELWTLASSDVDEATRSAALQEMIEMYHPDAEMDCTRTLPDFPIGRARAAMVTWVEGSREAYSSVLYEATEYIEAGEDVFVVAAHVSARGAISGAPMESDFAYLVRYRGEQIISATTYPTLREALDAAGRGQ